MSESVTDFMRRKMGSARNPSIFSFARALADVEPGLTASDLGKLFLAHEGRVIHKWLHFLDIYERHFAKYRDTPVHMLEIGVFKGGSLELWRKYFGDDAVLFGVDINPDCAARVTAPNQVRIGSQDDPAFLRGVAAEMGEIDIVLDDGSHVSGHQQVSFETLFPLVKDGGLYVIEDTHTAYWPDAYDGGYRREGTAIELMKQMIDDMHGWYHDKPTQTPAKDQIAAIHVYDSMIVLEKARVVRPSYVQVGRVAD